MQTSRSITSTLLRSFFFFWAFLALYKFGAALHYSILAPLGQGLLPLWLVGLILGGGSFAQMLLDVPAGHLVDRFGRKNMLFVGWIAFMLAALVLLKYSLASFLTSECLSVIGWLFFAPGVNAYVLGYAEHESSGRFMALRDTFFSMGVVLASISLPFVLLYTPAGMGVILAFILAASAITLFLAPPDVPLEKEKELPAHHYHIHRTSLKKTLATIRQLNPASGMLSLYSIAGATFYGAVWFVVPLVIANDTHQKLLGLGLGVFDFSIVVLGVAIGNLVDKGNKRLLVFYGLLVFAFMGLLLGATLGPLFLLIGFLTTAGDETAGLSLWSWLHSLDKEHARDGAVAGIISLTEDLGYAIGPAIAGVLYEFTGPAWTLAISAVPLLLAWIIYSIIVRPKITLPTFLSRHELPRMPLLRRHKS